MFKVYSRNEVSFQTIEKNGMKFENILATKNGFILSGHDHFIGSEEKARSEEIIHIEFDYNHGNYRMFYKGSSEILKQACWAINELNSGKYFSYNQQSILYGILIDCLNITHHKSTVKRHSKLDGINSLSTCCLDCEYCLKRMLDPDSICSHCYSETQQKTQLALQDRNTINGIILRNIIIPVWAWKKHFKREHLSKFFRIESFGDVANKTQAVNYINFMKAFPRIHFAVWSKNIGIWNFAFIQEGKPANCSFVYSCNKVNNCELHMLQTYSFIDYIFTVYDKKYISLHNITITCGGRSCMHDCIKRKTGCYFPRKEGEKPGIQNEELK